MILGKIYEFVDKNRTFPFSYGRGAFIGHTVEGCPRFVLNVESGIQCFINCIDSDFEEVDFKRNKINDVCKPIVKPSEVLVALLCDSTGDVVIGNIEEKKMLKEAIQKIKEAGL